MLFLHCLHARIHTDFDNAAHHELCHAVVMQATARTVGLGGLASWLPSVQAAPHVASFVRHSVLLGGFVPSVVLLRRLGAATWANLVPHAAAMSLCTAEMWWLIP